MDSKVFRNDLWEEKTFKSAKLLLNDLLGIFSENLKKKVNYSIIVLEPLRQFWNMAVWELSSKALEPQGSQQDVFPLMINFLNHYPVNLKYFKKWFTYYSPCMNILLMPNWSVKETFFPDLKLVFSFS